MTPLLERASELLAELVEVRRDLHRHPELAFRETRTAAIAADWLAALGYRVRRGVAGTGVVAELGEEGGPTVALRADMDALPIHERNEVGYRSQVPGVMHACGHDAHVTMLLGAARLLAEQDAAGELPPGRVRLLFQPAEEASDEEGLSGAARLVEDGAMDGVGAVFGLHVGPHLPSGVVALTDGPLFAGSDTFRVTVRGRAAHAARPHEGIDAVVLASHFVLACQHAVARRLSPLASGVLSIGRMAGGSAENVLAEAVALEGTLRYFTEEVRERLREGVAGAAGVVRALGGEAEVDLRAGYPPVVNDPAAAALARTAVAEALGDGSVRESEPFLGAEDFALLQRRAPGCFFWLGVGLEPPRGLHQDTFDLDEAALPRGAAALAACAVAALREPPPRVG